MNPLRYQVRSTALLVCMTRSEGRVTVQGMDEHQRRALGWALLGLIAIGVGLAVGGTFGTLLAVIGFWTALGAGVYVAVGLIRSR